MRAPSETRQSQPGEASILGLPEEATTQLLERNVRHRAVHRVVLYGSRALGRHHSGPDIDLCLEAPGMGLGELLELGAELDDLLLPWQVDLQVFHKLDTDGDRLNIRERKVVALE